MSLDVFLDVLWFFHQCVDFEYVRLVCGYQETGWQNVCFVLIYDKSTVFQTFDRGHRIFDF